MMEKNRIKQTIERYNLNIDEISDNEWDLIIKNYNDKLIEFASNDAKLLSTINKVKDNSQHEIKRWLYGEKAQRELTELSGSDMALNNWDNSFQNQLVTEEIK